MRGVRESYTTRAFLSNARSCKRWHFFWLGDFPRSQAILPLITHHNSPSRAHFQQTQWFHQDVSVSLRPANEHTARRYHTILEKDRAEGRQAEPKQYWALFAVDPSELPIVLRTLAVISRVSADVRSNAAPALCAASHSGPCRRQAFWPRAAPPQLRTRGFFGRSSLTTLFGPVSKHTEQWAMQSQRKSIAKQLGGTGIRLQLTSATHQ